MYRVLQNLSIIVGHLLLDERLLKVADIAEAVDLVSLIQGSAFGDKDIDLRSKGASCVHPFHHLGKEISRCRLEPFGKMDDATQRNLALAMLQLGDIGTVEEIIRFKVGLKQTQLLATCADHQPKRNFRCHSLPILQHAEESRMPHKALAGLTVT